MWHNSIFFFFFMEWLSLMSFTFLFACNKNVKDTKCMQCVVLCIKILSRLSSQRTVKNTTYMANIYHSGTNKSIFLYSSLLSDFFKACHSLTAWQLTLISILINDHSVCVHLSSPWQGTPLKTLKRTEMPSVLAFLRSRLPQSLSQRKLFLHRHHIMDILRRIC